MGSVISSSPPAGTEVKPDTAVTLVISDGVEPVAVPDVVGLPVQEAEAAVADAKLRSEVVEEFDQTVPAGVVVSQDPSSGTAGKRSVVTLVVSKGPPVVEVPDVVGRNVAEAQQMLTAAGFVPNVQQLPGGPGTVLNQNPGAGDKQPKGSTVTLYVF
jgi:serine/threonine-protein kinase